MKPVVTMAITDNYEHLRRSVGLLIRRVKYCIVLMRCLLVVKRGQLKCFMRFIELLIVNNVAYYFSSLCAKRQASGIPQRRPR